MVYLIVGLFLRALLPTVRVCVKMKGKLYFPTLPFPGVGEKERPVRCPGEESLSWPEG